MSQSFASRVTASAALAGVSVIAAVVSYLHGLAVVQMVGARPPVAYLIPFLADLVILGASASLLDASRSGRALPALSVVSLAVGIGATVAMNVAAGWHHGAGGRLVAAWPAVAFILALESLAGIVRRGRGVAADLSAPATFSHDQPPDPPSTDDALRVLLTTGSKRVLADSLGVTTYRVEKWQRTVAEPADDAGAGRDSNPQTPIAGHRDVDLDPATRRLIPTRPPAPAESDGIKAVVGTIDVAGADLPPITPAPATHLAAMNGSSHG